MTDAVDHPSTAGAELVTYETVAAAAGRIEGHAVRTPIVPAHSLSDRCGATVMLKSEHRQRTGSFKLRGALNTIFSLTEDEAARGVVTASSGNHGIGAATAAASRGVDCTVYLPSGASSSKVSAIDRLGASIVTVDSTDAVEGERAARQAAADNGQSYISPYNDHRIIAGQGTVGLEIVEDWNVEVDGALDAVVVAVGGGGLISGVATAIKHHLPDVTIVGASPANDPAMVASIEAGRIIEPPASTTFSDGTAGAVEAGSITFGLCVDLVDHWMTVPEQEIATAVTAMIDDQHELVEGAAGVALAAAERWGHEHPATNIVVVTCGANVSSAALRAMLAEAQSPE